LLAKQNVFGRIVRTPEVVKPVGHMDFCAKIKLRMMKLLNTKHNWLLKVVHKTLY